MEPWNNLYRLRNDLAHQRLPDIDDSLVRRITWMSADQLRDQVRQVLGVTG